MNIPNSFTLEATFCGCNYGPLKNCHMNLGHLQEVGASLCDSFLQYSLQEGYGKNVVNILGPITTTDYQVSNLLHYDPELHQHPSNNNSTVSSAYPGQRQQAQQQQQTLPSRKSSTSTPVPVDQSDLQDQNSVVGGADNNANDLSDSEDEEDEAENNAIIAGGGTISSRRRSRDNSVCSDANTFVLQKEDSDNTNLLKEPQKSEKQLNPTASSASYHHQLLSNNNTNNNNNNSANSTPNRERKETRESFGLYHPHGAAGGVAKGNKIDLALSIIQAETTTTAREHNNSPNIMNNSDISNNTNTNCTSLLKPFPTLPSSSSASGLTINRSQQSLLAVTNNSNELPLKSQSAKSSSYSATSGFEHFHPVNGSSGQLHNLPFKPATATNGSIICDPQENGFLSSEEFPIGSGGTPSNRSSRISGGTILMNQTNNNSNNNNFETVSDYIQARRASSSSHPNPSSGTLIKAKPLDKPKPSNVRSFFLFVFFISFVNFNLIFIVFRELPQVG
jgi:hypothetical protein